MVKEASKPRLACDEAPVADPDPPDSNPPGDIIMTVPIAGIDPHQRTFTVGIVDPLGVETHVETFDNTGAGYTALIDMLTTRGVRLVTIEGSRSWGVHVAVAAVAAGFDAREVPPSRTATQRRSRRLDHTDASLGDLDRPGVAGRTSPRPSRGTRRLRPAGHRDRSGPGTPPGSGRGPDAAGASGR